MENGKAEPTDVSDHNQIPAESIRFVQKNAVICPSAPFGMDFLQWKKSFWRERMASIKNVVAPMVDQSELAFRMMLRHHSAHLCFTPMVHAHLFVTDPTYRKLSFTTVEQDRPLIVQFCANDPQTLLSACRLVEGMCDGVDLNLGCPQQIAKKGRYGSFLQESPELIESMISTVYRHCHLPISAKIRVLDSLSSTIEYARRIEAAGASLLTVHGRTREQKGIYTGLADWAIIKAIKQTLKIPIIANGNIQMPGDVERCLAETDVEAVMSAEGVLNNPRLFDGANPLSFEAAIEYLEFADRYKATASAIRAHLFHMCHYSFLEYDDLRERNATICSLREFYENVGELRKRCLFELHTAGMHCEKVAGFCWSDFVRRCCPNFESLHELVLSTPHFFCKPYVRKVPKSAVIWSTNETDDGIQNASAISAYRQKRRAEIERLAEEAGVSKRQIRKREKRQRGRTKELNRKQTYPECKRCKQPAGMNCPWTMCRRCCKWTCTKRRRDEEGEEVQQTSATTTTTVDKYCKVHGFTPKMMEAKCNA
uniref:tRNA-dihydrouridine(16/17) synthase [NAD(P)(+)] n=1 Tax=Globodera pallida TaxID=36090 RepID=A0A183BUG5_GLOPA